MKQTTLCRPELRREKEAREARAVSWRDGSGGSLGSLLFDGRLVEPPGMGEVIVGDGRLHQTACFALTVLATGFA